MGRPFAKRVMSGEASTASAKAVAKKREREELSGSPGGETTVVEGSATLYFASDKGVFYNPAQIPNRDLSVLGLRQFVDDWRAAKLDKAKTRAAKAYASAVARGDAAAAAEAQAPLAAPTARVLDALSASGLRTIRYAKEVEGLSEVVANDLDAAAVEAMGENFARNGLESPLATSHVGDACAYLHESRPPTGERFQVVDLDPYGSAAPFLDAAVQSVDDGGLLMITCTDMAVLCGQYADKCYAKYGAWPLRGKHCHEQALRIVMASVDAHANRYGRYAEPLLCAHINFYVRLFVRVRFGSGSRTGESLCLTLLQAS